MVINEYKRELLTEKAWYASKFRGKIFTEAEKRDNELKDNR